MGALYTPPDLLAAYDAWGANCGPGALAAALGVPVMALRDVFPWFPRTSHTTPTKLEEVLRALALQDRTGGWSRVSDGSTPDNGVSMVQFTGPWTDPARASEPWVRRVAPKFTHFVAVATAEGVPHVYDVNHGEAGGWLPALDWEVHTVPDLLDFYRTERDKRVTGWSVALRWRVVPAQSRGLLALRAPPPASS